MRLTCAALIALILVGGAHAQVALDVSKITCDQYVHSKITTPNYIAAWMSGYFSAKRNQLILDPQALHDNVAKLEHYCYEEKNFKVPVLKAVQELLGSKK